MGIKILFRYVIKEIYPIFFAALLVSLFIVITTKMLSLTEMVVSHGASISHVAKILLFVVPEVLLFSLPAATLISVLVAFLRLSSDNEIIALKASGISLYQVLPPVISFSVVAALFSLFISICLVPWGNRNLERLLFQIVKAKADIGIKERVFCEPFKGILFYVNHFSPNQGIMKGVFVVDKRDKNEISTIVSEQAEIVSWPKKNALTFHFVKGTVFTVDKDYNCLRTIEFQTYDLNLSLNDVGRPYLLRKKPKEMGMKELIKEARKKDVPKIKHNLVIIELMERLSIPVAVFLMGIIGAPLGMQIKAKTRSLGIGIGLLVFVIYYVCLAGAKSICETGVIAPSVGMWIPDIILALACAYFIRSSEKDKQISFTFLKFKFYESKDIR